MSSIESKTCKSSEPGPSVHEPRVYVSTANPKPPLTEQEWANKKKPKVLIVGAGIGGLMLGNLLLKGNVPFLIFEKAKEVKPLGTLSDGKNHMKQVKKKRRLSSNSAISTGSAFSLGNSVSTLLKQLGIYDEFLEIGKPNKGWTSYHENLKKIFDIDLSERVAM